MRDSKLRDARCDCALSRDYSFVLCIGSEEDRAFSWRIYTLRRVFRCADCVKARHDRDGTRHLRMTPPRTFWSCYISYGVGSLKIKCGFLLAISSMVSAKTPLAQANQLPEMMGQHATSKPICEMRHSLVYEARELTSMLSCTRPSFADFRTRSRHPMISSSSSLVCAWMSKLMGQAFTSPM